MQQPGRGPAIKITEVVIMGMVIKALTCGDLFSREQQRDPSLFPPFFAGTTTFCFFSDQGTENRS